MAPYVPLPKSLRTKALPPGHDIAEVPAETPPAPLHLLFIGGFSQHYRLHELFAAVQQRPEVTMTVCTREKEWNTVRAEYEPHLAGNIHVVHRHGEGLKELFDNANIAVICIEPSEYRNFAAPLKFYEYIGNGKPILATNKTLTGEIVAEQDLGWSVDYGRDNFVALFDRLAANPAEVTGKRENVLAVRDQHSWIGRARTVVGDLCAPDRIPGPASD